MQFVAANLDKGELTLRCEQAIRNYDPCISCATTSSTSRWTWMSAVVSGSGRATAATTRWGCSSRSGSAS